MDYKNNIQVKTIIRNFISKIIRDENDLLYPIKGLSRPDNPLSEIKDWRYVYSLCNPMFHSNMHHCSVTYYPFYLYIIKDYCGLNNYKSKFRLLSDILSNRFYNETAREELFAVFHRIQQTYFVWIRFIKRCKHKMGSLYNNHDLLMNPLSRTQHNVIEIYHCNKVYLFAAADLINIMNRSLTHSPYFFSNPLPIKNPYNNIPFRKSDLYNIYFFIKNTSFTKTILIHAFFNSGFDLTKFQREHNSMIIDYSIDNYIYSTPVSTLYPQIAKMLRYVNNRNIAIHPEYSKTKAVEIMRPYLLLYYKFMYTLDKNKQLNSKIQLIHQLRKFSKANPLFGRKFVNVSKDLNVSETYNASNGFSAPKMKRKQHFNEIINPVNHKYEDFMNTHTTFHENMEDSSSDEDTD